MKKITTAFIGLIISTCTVLGQGTTVLWNQSVDGEMSQDYGSPTVLAPLQVGTDSIIASTEIVPTNPSWALYPDIFLITVPDNLVVTSINLQIDTPNVWAWIGDPSFANNQMGFTQNSASGDLLSQWGLSSIGAGTYGMYMQNLNELSVISVADYQLDFIVQSTPEPGDVALSFVGVACFIGLRFWKKQQIRTI